MLPEAVDDANNPTAAGLLVAGIYTGPYFDTLNSNEIRVQVGLTAVLPCRVRQAGDRSVSRLLRFKVYLFYI